MNPRDLLAKAFKASLSLDRYGEQVLYYAIDGGDGVDLRARITQNIQPVRDLTVDGREDVLRVAFCSDPAAVDAAGVALGGITEPQRGDALWRSGLGDPADKLYAFQGKVLNRSTHHWEVEFVRVEQQQVGMLGRR